MKWFDKWFQKKFQWAWDNRVETLKQDKITGVLSPRTLDADKSMHFTVTRASGGWVVEHRVYDQKTDRTHNHLHIITEDRDLGQELGKILMLESMRS
jgi:hypothetical protein